MTISVPPKGDNDKRIGANFSPLQVSAQAAPDMTVQIREGSFWTALGQHREFPGGNTPTISAPASDAKWVVVAINEDGLIQIFDGTPSGDPDLPTLPETVLPLAGLFIGDTTTAITPAMVFDLRPLWSIRPENVPNLAGELAMRPTITDVNSLLATKADLNGTPDTSFTLNKDEVGVPGSDVQVIVERGSEPNVSIAWRETTNQWEFTNDGVSWAPIGAAAGTYYTTTQLDGGQLNHLYYTKTQLDTGVLDSRYYEQSLADTTFAQITHPHMSTDIVDFTAAANAASPVQSVAGKVGTVTLVEADITDLDKYNTVSGAVSGNVVAFGPLGLADTGVPEGDLSLVGHTHVAADITDLPAAANAIIATTSINELLDVVSAGPLNAQVLVWSSSNNWYQNRYLNIGELGDVVNLTPSMNDALLFNGATYANRAILKSDVSDFVETDYVHRVGAVNETIDGNKTFINNVEVQGDLTVTGSTATIDTTNLHVRDKFFEINYGETGAGVGGAIPQDAGIRVVRGTEANALLYWNETSNQWFAGTFGDVDPIIVGNHNHVVAEITDFDVGVTTELNSNSIQELEDVAYPAAPAAGQVLYWNFTTTNWEPTTLASTDISNFATAVTAELNVNNVDQMQDVAYPVAPVDRDVLVWDGTVDNRWENRALVKADVSDFVEADYVHTFGTESIGGDKTFGNNIVIVGDLTVQGTTTTVNSATLEITDNIIVVNNGETGAGVSGGNAGMRADRGTLPDALMVWDELNDRWEAGIDGSTVGISLVGHTHVVANITDISVLANEINQLTGISMSETVQEQLDESLRRDGHEAMDPSFNLSVSAGGEFLGLPAVPSGATAATSMQYVDDQDAAITLSLTTHMSDDTVHITADQNTFLDGLNLPTLTAAEVNYMVGVTSGVQAQIDSKANLTVPATVNDIALLDAVGDLVDSGYRLNDAGTTVNDMWSASKIQTDLDTKADKVGGAVLGNFAGLDASGNLTDSGSNASTFALAAHTHDTADIITGTFADARIAASNVTQHVASIDHDALLNYSLAQHRVINDTSTAATDLWSANKIDSELALKSNVGHTHLHTDVTDFDTEVDARIAAFSGAVALTLDDLADVVDSGSGSGDFLRHNGVTYTNVNASLITDFVRTAAGPAQTVPNDITFGQDVTVTGDLIVNGTTTTVSSTQVEVGDAVLRLNSLLAPTSPPSVNAGFEINRGNAGDDAQVIWDETTDEWTIGTVSDMRRVAREGETVAQPSYEAFVAAAAQAVFTTGFSVPAPAVGKAAEQVFVNGIKQRPGALKQYTVTGTAPLEITFNAGAEPPTGADVEVYGFGTIG